MSHRRNSGENPLLEPGVEKGQLIAQVRNEIFGIVECWDVTIEEKGSPEVAGVVEVHRTTVSDTRFACAGTSGKPENTLSVRRLSPLPDVIQQSLSCLGKAHF